VKTNPGEDVGQRPAFVAFYSFKGGVGRSMALINAACILAGHGRRVLAIDLDLEAPGISYLVLREKQGARPTKGFVDFIYDILTSKTQSPLVGPAAPRALLRYTTELSLPSDFKRAAGGSLRIMPAGKMDRGYEQRRQDIDLHRLYLEQKGEPIVQHLRQLIVASKQFDYVLIDSRTGFADEAGISVRDLADHVIVLHGLNHQNVEGTARFLKRFKVRAPRFEQMGMAFVASPIPLGEDDLREKRMRIAESTFKRALNRATKIRLEIPYHPRLALDESPFIFRGTQSALHSAYGRIEDQVRTFNADTVLQWTKRFRDLVSKDQPTLAIDALHKLGTLSPETAKFRATRALQESVGKKNFPVYWEYVKSIGEIDVGALTTAIEHYNRTEQKTEASKLYEELLPRIQEDSERLAEAAQFFSTLQKDLAKAEELYKKAVMLSPKNALVLARYGNFLEHNLTQYTKAAALYRRAAKADPGSNRALIMLGQLLQKRNRNAALVEKTFRRAIEVTPGDPDAKWCLALLLARQNRSPQEAEALMRECAGFTPYKAPALAALAVILWQNTRNYQEARKQFNLALALDSLSSNTAANYAGFLLARGSDLNEAEKQIEEAWGLAYKQGGQIAAELAFYRAVLVELRKTAPGLPLRYLKHLFRVGYERQHWNLEDVLLRASTTVSQERSNFWRALADAVLNNEKVEYLNNFEEWRKLHPLPPGKEI
jgi:cellulose biosynthesis protein BcsQ/Tfp pilus assembly protein PilF